MKALSIANSPMAAPVGRAGWSRRRFVALLSGLALLASVSATMAVADEPPPVSVGRGFDETSGRELYRGICQACHMANGEGASGAAAYPALKANPRLGSAAYPIYNILHGRNGMPALGRWMTDEQVAAVVNYVRTHMDNHYPGQVSAEDVRKLR
jgi:mono/diheme cytochrome c family protein